MSQDSVYGPYGSGQGTPGAPHSSTLERVSSGPEQPRLRMRQRLAWFGAANRPPQSAVLDPLFSVVRANHPKADLDQLERAYHTAEHYHRGQQRKSGEPYITHPLAVATILVECRGWKRWSKFVDGNKQKIHDLNNKLAAKDLVIGEKEGEIAKLRAMLERESL